MMQTADLNCWAHFDYEQMALEALREKDKLDRIVRERKRRGPDSPDTAMLWDQENRRFYQMYLEQRRNAKDFLQRAKKRRSYGEA